MRRGVARTSEFRRIEKRIGENHGVPFTYDDDVVELIKSRCTELESGGRMIDAVLTNTVLPRISQEFLNRLMAGQDIAKVHICVADGDFSYKFE